jgi:two-component system response regulator YesN
MVGQMSGKRKILIADDEQNIIDMFTQLIHFDDLGLKLAGTYSDGESLRQAIIEQEPDIVITDIRMPVMDGLEVIRWCSEKGYHINFVVLSGYHQFEYAYNALKYKVDDYLLKPVNEVELNDVLKRIIHRLDNQNESAFDKSEVLRQRFMQSILQHNLSLSKTGTERDKREALNAEYLLHLQPGFYCFFYLWLDDARVNPPQDEQRTSIIEKLTGMGTRRMQNCSELISKQQNNGVKFFLNYDKSKQDEIELAFKNLAEETRQIADLFSGLHITLCVGDSVQSVSDIPLAEEHAWETLFCRFGEGSNRIIFYSQLKQGDLAGREKEWNRQIEQSWESLNRDEFTRIIHNIFSIAPSLRNTTTFAAYVRSLSWTIDNCRQKILEKLGQEVKPEDTVRPHLNTYKSYEDCCRGLVDIYGQELKHFIQMVEKKNLRPIRQACAYIEDHYQEAISLEIVAANVGLSPSYFSALFTRKMGQSFTDYVTLYRLQKACELLSASNMNINEIAAEVGFSDARYFSKLFRRKMGLKPTEYRRIYG